MIQGKCPTCKKPFQVQTMSDLPTFPFCSDRCRLIDLGRWIDGTNAIPGPELPSPPDSEGDEDDD